jgi:hypothetical protein
MTLAGKPKKPTRITNENSEDLDTRFLSTFHLYLVDDVLFNIVGKEKFADLWSITENIYMKKSLTN